MIVGTASIYVATSPLKPGFIVWTTYRSERGNDVQVEWYFAEFDEARDFCMLCGKLWSVTAAPIARGRA